MSSFGDRMKYLREKKVIKQSDISKDLHITQTAVSNYEKGIRFPNEALLVQIADYFNVSIDFLLGRDYFIFNGSNKEGRNPYNDELQLFTTEFLNNKHDRCHQIIDSLKAKKVKIAAIYTFIIQPTLYVIGSMWESGQISIAEEHFFTENMLALMQEQSRRHMMVQSKQQSVVLVSIMGEEHNIGIRMIGHVLKEEGYGVHYLGGTVPTEDLVQYLIKNKADVLALSATMSSHITIVKDIVEAIRRQYRIKIIVGGQAFKYVDYHTVDADAYSRNANEIADVIAAVLDVKS